MTAAEGERLAHQILDGSAPTWGPAGGDLTALLMAAGREWVRRHYPAGPARGHNH